MTAIAHYLSKDGTRRYSAPVPGDREPPRTHTLSDGTVLTLYLVWHSPTLPALPAQEATV
jgi:hypothetical protein